MLKYRNTKKCKCSNIKVNNIEILKYRNTKKCKCSNIKVNNYRNIEIQEYKKNVYVAILK